MTQSKPRAPRGVLSAFLVLAAVAAACAPAARPAASLPSAPAVPARPPLATHFGGNVNLASAANAPDAYMAYGLSKLGVEPDSAAAAFYWASRLDPWRAEPLYARSLAILLAHLPPAGATFQQRRRVDGRLTRAQAEQADSLMRLAMAHDPFLVRQWDYLLTARMKDPADAGYWAFDAGEYADAATLLGKALVAHPDKVILRGYRAQAFYHLRQYDSAGSELTQMLDSLVTRDEHGPSLVYRSKELVYYALGFVRVQQGDTARARDAFGRALSENLGFYMAHVRLAGIALAQRDTAGALREMEQALITNGADPALRFHYAEILALSGKAPDALDELRRAVELDPDYAAPYQLAGSLYEADGDTAAAVGSYRAFVAHSYPASPSYAPVVARLGALGAGRASPAATATPRP